MGGTVRIQGADAKSNSSAAEASRIACTSAARLYTVVVFNNSASDQYLQVFDASSVPANGTVPVLTTKVLAGQTGSFEFGDGIPMSTGITVCNSSTATTKTLGSADCLFCVTYRARLT